MKIIKNKKIIFSFFILLMLPFWVHADDNINKVFKIEAYDYNQINDSYQLQQYWSAIYYWDNMVYTNAHVILDDEDEPLGKYRLCKTIDFKEKPVCFSVWKLLYYDEIEDLAVLEISDPEVEWIIETTKKSLEIWDVVKVYWYPWNWWETISYTEWKISWYEDWYYKIDANLDSWNSWWWVFDLDWNLLWMAVSVNVWYTTMWYIIPLDKINEFKTKNNYSIEEYSEAIDEWFSSYSSLLSQVIRATKYSNNEIEIKNIQKYGFSVDSYMLDNNEEFYALSLSDEESEVSILAWNIYSFWKDYLSFDDYYKYLKEELKEMVEESPDDYSIYKTKKFKFQNKDAILQFIQHENWEVYLSLLVSNSQNVYQSFLIYWDSIKNQSFLNGLRIILLNSQINSVENELSINDEYISMDNLSIKKLDNFYTMDTISWDSLMYFWDDIKVLNSTTGISKTKSYKDETLSSIIKSGYNYLKDYYDYNYVWIKQTDSWENYSYTFMKNDIEDEPDKKEYYISASFFDVIDDDEFYMNNISFEFDNIKSKKVIDALLNSIKTSSWDSPVEKGTLEVWENLVEE